MLTLKAHAKLNLTLEVLGRRSDGYHETASIMQTLDLHDTLRLSHADAISIDCNDATLATPDNLAYRAAELLREESGYTKGAHISIHKSIPVSAGLGGGSSDAAATLRGLNELWGLGMTHTELHTIAAKLGSDVPFLLNGGAAIALGRGERVRHLPNASTRWLVLLTPDVQPKSLGDSPDTPRSKTAAMYAMLDSAHYTKGLLTRKLEARIRGGGDVPAQLLFNAFDSVAFEAYAGIERCWNAFGAVGAREIHLTGSGPTMYALVSSREVGSAISLLLRHKHGWNARLASTIDPHAP